MPELDSVVDTEAFADDAAQGGELSAWRYRLAVARHHAPVYRMARTLLGNSADAEDVTQESFIRYWQHGDSVRRPREWLMKVARNACFDRLRKAGRFITVDDYKEDLLERPDDRDPAWHFEQRELAARLQRAIEALTEPQRSLVVLFDVQGMSANECARIIGLNVNQVKVYLHRARRRLRLALEESK